MLEVFLVTLVLVSIAFVALGVNVFFAKRPFPETEVGHNKKMKELGIECAKCSEWRRFKEIRRYKDLELDFSKLEL